MQNAERKSERPPATPLGSEEMALVAKALRDEERELRSHPEPEKLLACRAGELPLGEEEEVLEHVGVCRRCSELLLFLAAGEDPAEVSNIESANAWRQMRSRIREWERGSLLRRLRLILLSARWRLGRLPPAARRWFANPAVRGRFWLGLGGAAAAMLLTTGALLYRAQGIIADLSRPQANVPVVDLGLGRSRGGLGTDPGVGEIIALGSEHDLFTLVVHVEDPTLERYDARLLDSAGEELWRCEELEVELGVASLVLSQHFLSADDYFVEVTGRRGDRQATWVYPIRFNPG